MIRVIQHNCARSYKGDVAALEPVDECWVDEVCMQLPQKDRGDIAINYSAYEI